MPGRRSALWSWPCAQLIGTNGEREALTHRLGFAAHHLLPHQRDRRAAIAQELVVERLPRFLPAAAGRPVVAQFADHQLAHRIVEIGWVVGPARGLLPGVARVLVTLVAEQ